VHRDIKPENILLETDGENGFSLKIIDFGASVEIKDNKLNDIVGTSYYMAPEVLKRKYDEKCDIWSTGVMTYVLLTGKPLYKGSSEEVMKKVEKGEYDLSKISISEDAKKFLRALMEIDVKKRLTAIMALEHPWIKKNSPENCLINNYTSKMMDNFKSFRADEKLLEATLAFITNQLTSKDEITDIRKMFLDLDVNHDGLLAYEEIVQVYKKVYNKPNAEEEAKEIFKKVDSDKSGYISYDEFIRACVDKKKILTEDRLEQAFKMFDKNGDGSISSNEIKSVLQNGKAFSDQVWNDIIKEVDIDGDGQVSINEFKVMMLKIMQG
jgi:calcium-dependent protein kinase